MNCKFKNKDNKELIIRDCQDFLKQIDLLCKNLYTIKKKMESFYYHK